jgi:hypothetical protein
MPELRPAEKKWGPTPVVIRQPGRQVGRSAGRQVGSGALTWAKGPARRLERDHLGGDARLGPPRATSGHQASRRADYRNFGTTSRVG